MASVYELAGQADSMLAAQKDDFYRDTFVADTTAVLRHVKGARFAAGNEPLVTAFADVLLGTIDNVLNIQTLGEEYCSLVQVSTITSRLASLPERLISVTSQSVVPVLVHSNIISRTVFLRMLRAFQQWGGRPKNDAQAAGADENSSVIENSEEDVQHMKRVQHLLSTVVWPLASRVHLMMFYFNGMYYRVAHRIAGIRHVVLSSEASRPMEAPNYRILGVMMAAQLILQGSGMMLEYLNRKRAKHQLSTAPTEDARDVPTVTPCGHVLCWECVSEWCATKQECPVCRQTVDPKRLVRLFNWS